MSSLPVIIHVYEFIRCAFEGRAVYSSPFLHLKGDTHEFYQFFKFAIFVLLLMPSQAVVFTVIHVKNLAVIKFHLRG